MIYPHFQQVARRQPDALAIRGDRLCTYAELDRRARAVARGLEIPAGSAAAVLVGADPVAEIAAILGVIAAGGVVVPIDAREPALHVARVVRHCRPAAVLAESALMPLAASAAPGVAVREVRDDEDTAGFSVADVSADAAAYICYTSGTTGEPKGIASTHRRTVVHARASAEALGHGPDDRHTLLHSLAAGGGRATLWRALLSGGSLLPRRVIKEGVGDLLSWLDAEGATVLFCSPTLYRTFVAGLAPTDQLRTVRILRLVGERVLPGDFASFKRHFRPGARFVNAYSLTEVGNVTMSVLTHESIVPADELPVGYPLTGGRVRIVDEHGQDVPAGAAGEIAVDTFDGSAQAFMTGDLGRIDPDGQLFHLGRRDFQVKIRGFRVELEGVEATLLRAPGVTQCAALVRDNAQGEATLVAFVSGDVHADRLREFAAANLAEGSVPSVIRVLESLPLTASGKVDRRALAVLENASTSPGSESSWSTRSATEQVVAGIWRELLGHDRFGADEDFLTAGGDSLLAMRMLARARQRAGAEVALADFLAAPTVAALAAAIDRRRDDQRGARDAELARLLDEIQGAG